MLLTARLLLRLFLLAVAVCLPRLGLTQISMAGSSYSQSFDSLAGSGTGIPWTNNVTLPGWYASRSAAPNEVTNYSASAGSSTTGSLYSYGTAGSSDRALGSIASGTPGNFAYGVRFANDTGYDRTNITVSYTGEQWRAVNSTTQKLAFSYVVGSSLTDADARNLLNWTAVPALDFNSPNTNSPQALNGNEASNRVVFTTVVLSGFTVPAGLELFIRWFDPDDAGADDGLAIDDLTVGFGMAVTNANPSPGGALSVLTYNCHGNFVTNWSTNSIQVQAIARQMQYLQPDIITFQEIPLDLRYEMTNFVSAFLPGYSLAMSNGTDGFITSAILSRFPITRFNKWLDNADLDPYGYTNSNFTRDLFEAQISVPDFPYPLHVFTTHLKSGSTADDNARRAAEASAISNYFVNEFLTTNVLHPYLLTGDLNEDILRPPGTSLGAIQRLTNASVGLRLTTPLNPLTHADLTHSIQGTLDRRYDYILPNGLLYSNIQGGQVFRTDLLNPVPPNLNSNDDVVASDHLPVMLVFRNPYDRPFWITSIGVSNQMLTLQWESVNGRQYGVDASPDATVWSPFAANLTATGTNATFTTNVSAEMEFFRVYRVP